MLIDILNSDKKELKATEITKEEVVVDSVSDGEQKKYLNLELHDTEKTVFAEAIQQGSNVYGVTVFVQSTCILKAARAFLVFKAIEEIGEIMVSNPSVQDIEDEKFDTDFSLMIISDESLEKVITIIQNVSDIKEAIGEKMSF